MVNPSKIPQRILSIFDDLADFRRKRSASVVEGLPIIIIGLPRSGTTMLAELFNSPRVMYYHEPFLKKSILWNPELANKNESAPADMAAVKATCREIENQRAWQYYRKSNSKYPYLTKGALHKTLKLRERRIIIKGPSLCYWLDDLLPILGPACPVFIQRDPRGIVASLKALNWDPMQRLHTIYNHTFFSNKLPASVLAYKHTFSNMNPIERMALQTGVLSYCMHQQELKVDNAIHIDFEALVENPLTVLHKAGNMLQLPDNYFAEDHINSILKSTESTEERHRYKRQAEVHIDKWKTVLTETESNRVMEIYNSIMGK